MGKALVIVESPAKAKTINRYLGDDFIVKSSVGHIRDLPVSGTSKSDPKARAKEAAKTRKMPAGKKEAYKKQKARKQLVARMGIDPDNDWKANYEILPDKEKVVAELKKLAKDADEIYLATDLDREGEAIAWHLREAIGGDESRYRRVVFNEITKKAIQEAFEEPGEINMDRVSAQQARRFLDRVVGFMVSPLLWAKIARGLSAGRVQSVAVKLIVEREREIRAFVPQEYWDVYALLNEQGKQDEEGVKFGVTKEGGEYFRPTSKEATDKALEKLRNATFKVSSREDKPTQTRPTAPYITSTLQQAASTRLGFGVKKTMMMAQRLYEAGYITYMRTDSTNLSVEAVNACRDLITSDYGKKYLLDEPRIYSSKVIDHYARSITARAGYDGRALKAWTLVFETRMSIGVTRIDVLKSDGTITIDADFDLSRLPASTPHSTVYSIIDTDGIAWRVEAWAIVEPLEGLAPSPGRGVY